MKRALILLIVLLFSVIVPVMADNTISFANPHETTQKDIYVYNVSGSLLGIYNTTSSGIALTGNNTAFLIVLKPQYTTPLEDPVGFLGSMLAYAQTNMIAIIVILFLIGILYAGRR
jgi:hypothetical protein